MKVAVVGAGGHVGLPFSLVVGDSGHEVYGIDINQKIVNDLNNSIVPYIEHGAQELLDKKVVTFTTDASYIKDCDVVAIMLGTPVDEENNARLDDLFNFVDNILIPNIKQNQLIILRSTVSPGTTEVLRDRIESKTHFKEGEKFFLVFCPERVLQTRGIEETKKLPQLIGAFSEQAYNKATEFFKTITNTTVSTHYKFLSPREAEIAKLITNMWRYVSFAFANEMWMIGEKQGVDIHKVIEAANYKYSRMAVPLPGPNVGGPCLFKDGRFLLPDVPFVDLIQTSFIINEGMPDYIWNCITKLNPNIKNVLILGASFKADCDDTRNSLSFKMRKVCKKHGVDVKIYDPHVDGFDNSPGYDHDAVIIMTPHNYFSHILPTDFNNSCIVADVWKHWALSGKTISGIYRVGDVK